MKKQRLIKYNRLLVSHKEAGIMINEIINGVPISESKIEFTPYKTGLWNLIADIMDTLERGESLEMTEEEDKN